MVFIEIKPKIVIDLTNNKLLKNIRKFNNNNDDEAVKTIIIKGDIDEDFKNI